MTKRGAGNLGCVAVKMAKRAVSPVITTVLLVLIVIVLASIIFIWGATFIPEALTKFDRPIEEKCNEAKFAAEISGTGAAAKVAVISEGDVPIYRFGIKKEGQAESTIKYSDPKNLLPGGSTVFSADLSGTSSGDKVSIIPILLGKTQKGKVQEYPCEEGSWQVLNID